MRLGGEDEGDLGDDGIGGRDLNLPPLCLAKKRSGLLVHALKDGVRRPGQRAQEEKDHRCSRWRIRMFLVVAVEEKPRHPEGRNITEGT